jgi:hypothetical protein
MFSVNVKVCHFTHLKSAAPIYYDDQKMPTRLYIIDIETTPRETVIGATTGVHPEEAIFIHTDTPNTRKKSVCVQH